MQRQTNYALLVTVEGNWGWQLVIGFADREGGGEPTDLLWLREPRLPQHLVVVQVVRVAPVPPLVRTIPAGGSLGGRYLTEPSRSVPFPPSPVWRAGAKIVVGFSFSR